MLQQILAVVDRRSVGPEDRQRAPRHVKSFDMAICLLFTKYQTSQKPKVSTYTHFGNINSFIYFKMGIYL